jgi:hypothetical protein
LGLASVKAQINAWASVEWTVALARAEWRASIEVTFPICLKIPD